MERFIREFILEESPLDVREVRAALQAYDDTRKRLEKQEDEAAFLRSIGEQHALYETNRREEALLQHTAHTLKLLQAEERRERHAVELKRLEDSNADDIKNLSQAIQDAAQVGKLLDEVRFQIGKDPEAVKIAELESKKTELQEKVKALQEARKSARQQLDDRHYRWMQWLKHGAALPLANLKEALVVDETQLANLRSGTNTERLVALQKLAQQFNENKGWDKIVKEVLTASGAETDSPAILFYLANQDMNQPSPAKLVGATANLFLGLPLHCAECHVHPTVDQWTQKDFWGLAAFFGHVRFERDGGVKAVKQGGPVTLHEVERGCHARHERR